jgi:hypothetical protein
MAANGSPWKKPSVTEIQGMKNKELKDTLIACVARMPDGDAPNEQGIGTTLNLILQRQESILSAVQQERKEREKFAEEIGEVKEENIKLRTALYNQQRYLESLEYEKRGKNLVITGLDDNDEESGEPVSARVGRIFSAINLEDIQIIRAERIGQIEKTDGSPEFKPRPRPIKVVLQSTSDRQKAVEGGKKLKESRDETLKKIFIKRDTHIAVRREYGRL